MKIGMSVVAALALLSSSAMATSAARLSWHAI